MKKLAYIVLFFTQLMAAQSAFDKGNEQYREGKYEEAAQSYESILEGGEESAEVYFNLGNAYYKLNQTAPAIYNYEKALLLKPNDKDIKVNLGFAQKMVIDDIQATPKVGFSKLFYGLVGIYHYDTWAWIAVGFAFGVLLFFIGYYFAGSTLLKRMFFAGILLSLVVIVISVISATFVRTETSKMRPAIVFSEVASVKSEPLNNAPDAFILHEGTKVNVVEVLDNWKKVTLADESTGWIKDNDIKELKD